MADNEVVTISRPSGARCEVQRFGAHVKSWAGPDGQDRLFMSSIAEGKPKALRGGIPVCFPQFANRGPGGKHGFARQSDAWKVLSTADEPVPTATFELTSDESTAAAYPHAFRLLYHVSLPADDKLTCALQVINKGEEPMEFTAALHTYFRVADVEGIAVEGLQGTTYEDSAAEADPETGAKPLKQEAQEAVPVAGEVDRIYFRTPANVAIKDGPRKVAILAQGFKDTVLWNIGAEKAPTLKDLGPGEWKHYVCVESGVIEKPVKLEPMNSWMAGVTYKIE